MKQCNDDLENIMNEALKQHSTSSEFESVWHKTISSKRRRLGFKRLLATPLIALLALVALSMVGFTGYKIFRNIDRTDYPFVNDPRVIGMWQSVDFVDKIEEFNPQVKSWKTNFYLTNLVFIKNGKMIASSENENLADTSDSWTKGMVINKQEKTASKYLIKEIAGNSYMFVQWKSGDYIFRSQTPKYYVLKKINSKDYSNYQLKPVKEDNVNYPFVYDTAMKGEWKSVDYVQNIDDFTPGKKSCPDKLPITGLYLDANGKLTFTSTSGSSSSPSVTWTKGLIINKENKTASHCDIREIDGKIYMFFEWKTEDYVYRGKTPGYYVLEKVR